MTPPINSVSIKPLKWSSAGTGCWMADTPCGTWTIIDYYTESDGHGFSAFWDDEALSLGDFATREEAEKACFADYAKRIQSCLTSPASEPVAWQGKTWFELREPGCVPQRTGPIPATEVAAFLRDLFAHRPRAYVTVITVGHDGPSLQDGPECLQMLDGRSMSTGRKHIASSSAAHQGHPAPSALREVTATHRHVKRGTEYVLIGIGKMQAEKWLDQVEPATATGFAFAGNALAPVDMREVAIYRSADDGSLWVRPREEFEDGRFEALLAALPEREG